MTYHSKRRHSRRAGHRGAQVSSRSSTGSWSAARKPSSAAEGRRQKFATSRSRSADSVSTPSTSDVKAQLAMWKKEADAKKQAEKKKMAKKQFDKALLNLKYCVGNMCPDAVGDFCAAKQLAEPEETELRQFIRYAKEKGIVEPDQKADVETLCKIWAQNRL